MNDRGEDGSDRTRPPGHTISKLEALDRAFDAQNSLISFAVVIVFDGSKARAVPLGRLSRSSMISISPTRGNKQKKKEPNGKREKERKRSIVDVNFRMRMNDRSRKSFEGFEFPSLDRLFLRFHLDSSVYYIMQWRSTDRDAFIDRKGPANKSYDCMFRLLIMS